MTTSVAVAGAGAKTAPRFEFKYEHVAVNAELWAEHNGAWFDVTVVKISPSGIVHVRYEGRDGGGKEAIRRREEEEGRPMFKPETTHHEPADYVRPEDRVPSGEEAQPTLLSRLRSPHVRSAKSSLLQDSAC